MISIAGRPRRNWDASVKVKEDRLVIRIDDRDDPPFWIEFILCPEEMERIVAEWSAYLARTRIELADFELTK